MASDSWIDEGFHATLRAWPTAAELTSAISFAPRSDLAWPKSLCMQRWPRFRLFQCWRSPRASLAMAGLASRLLSLGERDYLAGESLGHRDIALRIGGPDRHDQAGNADVQEGPDLAGYRLRRAAHRVSGNRRLSLELESGAHMRPGPEPAEPTARGRTPGAARPWSSSSWPSADPSSAEAAREPSRRAGGWDRRSTGPARQGRPRTRRR